MEGNVVGQHAGQQKFTIGQRRGIGIALPEPAYIIAKDPKLNTVTIGGEANCSIAILIHVCNKNKLADQSFK